MMQNDEKLRMVRSLIGFSEEETADDARINAYLSAAAKEIMAWRYSYDASAAPKDVPDGYEMTQIMAVVVGYSQSGAEGQATHSENGISRTFNYPDMVNYIRRNVIAKVGVL